MGFTGSNSALALATYALVGIALGMATNRINEYAETELSVRAYAHPVTSVGMKLIPTAATLLALQAVSGRFAADWQATTPGLFFVGLYFTMQTSLTKDLARLGRA